MIFYVVELLDDWNVDVPSWNYPRNLESHRVSSPGFDNDSKMMDTLVYARRPVRCVPLTATHCHLQLTWSKEHALWTPQQWSCVMFSPTSPGLVCSLILAGLQYGERQVPVNTKRTPLNDTVTVVQDGSRLGRNYSWFQN
ncbi:transposable element Tcb2 transposase [Trichonephila clavipes]|nr:transposable element Tcb2 transposase [Trichonephila clavipes]